MTSILPGLKFQHAFGSVGVTCFPDAFLELLKAPDFQGLCFYPASTWLRSSLENTHSWGDRRSMVTVSSTLSPTIQRSSSGFRERPFSIGESAMFRVLSAVPRMCNPRPDYRLRQYRDCEDFPPATGPDRIRHGIRAGEVCRILRFR